jgi:hypothetical protein
LRNHRRARWNYPNSKSSCILNQVQYQRLVLGLSLRLDNVDKNAIAFSDRPDWIILTQSVEDFVGNWGLTQISFGNNTPNAVLVLEDDEEMKQDVLEIKLFNPNMIARMWWLYTTTLLYWVMQVLQSYPKISGMLFWSLMIGP